MDEEAKVLLKQLIQEIQVLNRHLSVQSPMTKVELESKANFCGKCGLILSNGLCYFCQHLDCPCGMGPL